jgi:plastocyanin
MSRRILVLAMAAALGASAPASAAELTITTPGRSFSPARPTVVTGDTVRWRNTDQVTHNVTGPTLRSGELAPGAGFSRLMDAPGEHPFVCTLHPFMSGQVTVVGVLLAGPDGAVLRGSPVTLTGRVAPGAGNVTIERLRRGAGEPAATAEPGPDGAFKAYVTPLEASTYRAVVGQTVSSTVAVRVVTGVAVGLKVRRARRWDRLSVTARPRPPKATTAVLELYSRERFSWRRAGHRRLDARGRTSFRLRAGLRRRARVVLVSRAGAQVAVSSSVRLWRPGGRRPPRSRDIGHGAPGHAEAHSPTH